MLWGKSNFHRRKTSHSTGEAALGNSANFFTLHIWLYSIPTGWFIGYLYSSLLQSINISQDTVYNPNTPHHIQLNTCSFDHRDLVAKIFEHRFFFSPFRGAFPFLFQGLCCQKETSLSLLSDAERLEIFQRGFCLRTLWISWMFATCSFC